MCYAYIIMDVCMYAIQSALRLRKTRFLCVCVCANNAKIRSTVTVVGSGFHSHYKKKKLYIFQLDKSNTDISDKMHYHNLPALSYILGTE